VKEDFERFWGAAPEGPLAADVFYDDLYFDDLYFGPAR
jgi:hypothetical protein